MLIMQPIIIWSAVSLAIYTATFVPLFTSMMKPDKDAIQEHKALLAMSWLGLGCIFGSISTGQILDRFKNPHKLIIAINLVYLTIAMTLLLYFTLRNEWSLLLASFLSFFMGLQDGALNTVLFVYLGF